MKKVFLLLRDNNQLGPFTIDELLQQKLTPNDLIWVEGYSLAWSQPSELDLLKLSVAEAAPSIDVKPSAPDDNLYSQSNNAENPGFKNKRKRKWADEDIEGRAEEIRRRTLEYVSSKDNTTAPLITDDDIRSFVKTPDIDFVVHKKSKAPSANFIGAALVAIMLIAGWYGKDKLFLAQNKSDISTIQAATPQVIPISSTVQMQPSQNESAAFISEVANDSVEVEEPIILEEPIESQKSYTSTAKPTEQPAVFASTTDNNNKIVNTKPDEEIETEKLPVKETEEPKSKPAKKDTAAVSSKPDSSKVKTEATLTEEKEETIEKKKTLGQAIKGIFKKKKRDKDSEDEIENDN